jgi:Tfp pilus assembly protein PilF
LNHATDEYIAAQELNAERPEAHLNLGLLYARENNLDRADAELKTALSLDPAFAPAAVNLADLYRGEQRIPRVSISSKKLSVVHRMMHP